MPVKQTKINLFCIICRNNILPGEEYGHSDDNIVYRARFYKVLGTPRIYLEAKDHQQAIIEAHNIRLSILKDGYVPKKKIILPKASSHLMTDLIDKYIAFTKNEGVSKNLKTTKNRSTGYISERIRYLGFFRDGLVDAGVDLKKFIPIHLHQKLAEQVYEYLAVLINPKSGKIYSPFSFNKFIGEITSFFIYLKKTMKLNIDNHFETFKRKSTAYYKPVAIGKNELKLVLDKIEELKQAKFCHEHFDYLDLDFWLRNTFLLELATNRRRDDFMMAKWSDIFVDEDGDEFLKVKDYKVSRQKDTDVYFDILISPELKNILIELGYETYNRPLA